MHRRYLLTFALSLLPVLPPLCLNYLYLRNTGEFLTLPEIVERQQTDPGFCIYGTALHADTIPYKVEGYSARRPRVALVGSSYMMSFRERYFDKPFYSLSQTTDSSVAARLLLPMLVETHKPDVLFFGMTFWWFRNDVRPYRREKLDLGTPRLTPDKLLQPFVWLLQGKVSAGDYLHTALGSNDPSAPCAIGVFSREKRQGFGPDGSYYSTSVVEGRNPKETSPKFAKQLREIERSENHFVHAKGINEEAVTDIAALIRDLRARGVAVVPFFTPVAPRVYAEMQLHREDYLYIPAAIAALRKNGVEVLDFLDPASVGAEDCEFIDGDHTGDIASARILRAIAGRTQDPLVRSAVNGTAIDTAIRDYAGFAMVPDPRVSDTPETDFLELGCPKKSPSS